MTSTDRSLHADQSIQGGRRALRENGKEGEEGKKRGKKLSRGAADRIPASRFYVLSLVKYGVGSRKIIYIIVHDCT